MNNYGANSSLSYNEYLKVPELIRLQNALSEPVSHDELLFIVIHQTYELWFKQILHEIDASIGWLKEDRTFRANHSLKTVTAIGKVVVSQIHILETMAQIGFLEFRDKLNPASGFQSMQFREIEFASGLKDQGTLDNFREDQFAHARLQTRFDAPTLAEAFYSYLRRHGGLDAPADDATLTQEERTRRYGQRTRAVLEVLTHFEERPVEFGLAEALIEHDEYFSLWRSHHVKMVERMVGTKRGTGGSEGVGYLRSTLDQRFFPELWEARTYLDTKHGAGGCPFAGHQQ